VHPVANRLVVAAGAATLAACSLAGCSLEGATDKLGGTGAPVTLTMVDVAANQNGFPAVQYFLDRVSVISGGRLRVEVKPEYTNFASDAEQRIVRDVADGKADLARIGTRAFDRLEVPDFEALTAPLLIDNYPLQQAVFDAGIPAQMLTGLEPLGVTGLGVLAGPLRHPVGTEPLVALADWHGATVETRASDGEVAAVEAFGGRSTEIVGPALDRGLASHEVDGLVTDLLQFDQNSRENTAPYVTANVPLWPQTIALIVNTDRLARLTQEQRSWLRQAADDAVAYSLRIADQDATLMLNVCARGARFIDATPTQLQALRDRVVPFYARIEGNPVGNRYFDQIIDVKQHTYAGLGLPVPRECTGPAPIRMGVDADPEATAALNGTYRRTLTPDDSRRWFAAHGLPPETAADLSQYPDTATHIMKDGTWTSRESSFPGQEGHGTYAVKGDLLTWYWSEGGQATFTFTVDPDGTLHLAPVPGNPDSGGDFVMSAKPWIKIG